MLNERSAKKPRSLEEVPAIREFLRGIGANTHARKESLARQATAAYVAGLDQASLRRLILALDCDWDSVLRDHYGPKQNQKHVRRLLVAGVMETARALKGWDQTTAFACLAAIVDNPGIPWPNHPWHFSEIGDLLGLILADGIRLPSDGHFALLQGRLGLYFKPYAAGDSVMRQVNELFDLPHSTFRIVPIVPFEDPTFRQFLEAVAEGRRHWTFDGESVLDRIENDYQDWEAIYGSRRWFELEAPALPVPLPKSLHELASSLSGSGPSEKWLARASKAIDADLLSRSALDQIADMLGTRALAVQSETSWIKAKPAFYLYGHYRYHHGSVDPIKAARDFRGRLKLIVEKGAVSDNHVQAHWSGISRNPLTISKQNTPLVKAACWCLSIYDDESAAFSLGEILLTLETSFTDSGRGRYLRSLAGTNTAIDALRKMKDSAAQEVLASCAEVVEDPRVIDRLRS